MKKEKLEWTSCGSWFYGQWMAITNTYTSQKKKRPKPTSVIQFQSRWTFDQYLRKSLHWLFDYYSFPVCHLYQCSFITSASLSKKWKKLQFSFCSLLSSFIVKGTLAWWYACCIPIFTTIEHRYQSNSMR